MIENIGVLKIICIALSLISGILLLCLRSRIKLKDHSAKIDSTQLDSEQIESDQLDSTLSAKADSVLSDKVDPMQSAKADFAPYVKADLMQSAKADPALSNALRKRRKWLLILGILLLWICCGLVMGIFAESPEKMHVQMMAPRLELFGFSISSSVVIGWCVTIFLIVIALIIRLFVIPKFSDTPNAIQTALESMVEGISNYTKEKSGITSDALNAFMMTIALFLIGCAVAELFSLRPPTADIVSTLSLALTTFVMINYYGIRKNGVLGRITGFAKPTPIVFPFRVLSDFAIPVSLACRLFGNMLGGMIVMHLLYMALGAFGVGIPAVFGLYFNVFHPIIQVFIYVTLSLTFIGEAVE